MKVKDMKPLVAYRVTKESSDKTFMAGEVMWLSKDGALCVSDGALNPDEWLPETINFEVEEDSEYYVDKWGDTEGLRKRKENAGCDCCNGDSPLYWKDNENNAFIDGKGEVQVTVDNKTITFPVKHCPSCGRKF